ncbi:hypothetical protein C922_05340 [Plasmodium inui San Antonio 1]|uniref:Uncharacterized protein n=1 Tax=Plasmodium inui San Antonio 1 TaxID=1237626 RepID=W7A599_9APIC|nr:hypothetical protein C922_05340 [Plasmodium inui San Antonio 1]EUD64274.1 hypothetical protein C922_05340 [Plasmodium inui San Antonio 1]
MDHHNRPQKLNQRGSRKRTKSSSSHSRKSTIREGKNQKYVKYPHSTPPTLQKPNKRQTPMSNKRADQENLKLAELQQQKRKNSLKNEIRDQTSQTNQKEQDPTTNPNLDADDNKEKSANNSRSPQRIGNYMIQGETESKKLNQTSASETHQRNNQMNNRGPLIDPGHADKR